MVKRKKKASRNVKSSVRKTRDEQPSKQAGYLNWNSVQISPNRKYNFAPLYSDPKQELDTYSRVTMLRKSRQFENNCPVYKQLVETYSRFVVGRGINPSPVTVNRDNQGNLLPNDVANNLIAFVWSQWANSEMCCVDQVGTLNQNLLLACERLIIDGEVFALFTYTDSGYPQFQLIDPSKVCTDDSEDDPLVVDGIAYNSFGLALSYRVQTDNGFQTFQAKDVCHIFDKKRIGQGRGFPWAQSAFNSMQDLEDIDTLEVFAAKISSTFAGQLVNSGKGQGAPDLNGLFSPRNKQPQPVPQGEELQDADNPAEMEHVTLGGKVLDLNDKEFKLIESSRPSPAYHSLRESIHRDICQAVGIPYEVAYNPELAGNGANNVVTELTRAAISEVQQVLIQDFLRPLYSWVISVQLRKTPEGLAVLKQLQNENPFLAHWNTPKKFGVTRNDTMNAVLLVNNKMITLQRFYAENYGEDWLPNIKQRIDEEAQIANYAKSKGVDMSQVVYGPGTTSVKEASTDDDSNDKVTPPPTEKK